MTLPFALPDWLPWWIPIVVLVPALLWLLAFLFVPFSVLGIKGRLDVMEARLDEIQGEIRSLALRLPEIGARAGYDIRGYDELYAVPPRAAPPADAEPVPDRPPIQPASADWYDRPAPIEDRNFAARRAQASSRGGRAEPRLDWPER